MTATRTPAVLALSFNHDTWCAALLGATGTPPPITAPLVLDPLSADPALLAQDWRERLQPLGSKAQMAVVGLPLERVMISTVAVPAMPAEALAGYLYLQAEREFFVPAQELAIGWSLYETGAGARAALLAALPVARWQNVRQTLRLLGYKRVQLTLASLAWLPPSSERIGGSAFLVADGRTVECGVAVGGALALLRRLDSGATEAADATPAWPLLASECRVTLGQLPGALQSQVRQVQVVAPTALAAALVTHLSQQLPVATWKFTAAPVPGSGPAVVLAEATARLAEQRSTDRPLALLLVPPPQPRRRGYLPNWTRRQWVLAGSAAALLLLTLGGLVGYQQHQLTSLKAQWQALTPRADAVRAMVAHAKAEQRWLNKQPDTLTIMRAIAYAFPERGSVWTTHLTIKDRHQVALAGKALNREAWLTTLNALRKTPGVGDLRIAQAREAADGRSPMTFALSFTWTTPAPTAATKQGAAK